jgi:hypothetical protein
VTWETTAECEIFQLFGQHDNKWCKIYTWNWTQDCHGTSSIQQEEDSFNYQTVLKFKEEN